MFENNPLGLLNNWTEPIYNFVSSFEIVCQLALGISLQVFKILESLICSEKTHLMYVGLLIRCHKNITWEAVWLVADNAKYSFQNIQIFHPI